MRISSEGSGESHNPEPMSGVQIAKIRISRVGDSSGSYRPEAKMRILTIW